MDSHHISLHLEMLKSVGKINWKTRLKLTTVWDCEITCQIQQAKEENQILYRYKMGRLTSLVQQQINT